MGHLIPAGTGSPSYKSLVINVDEPEEALPAGIASAPPVAEMILDDGEFKGELEISEKKSLDQA